MNIIKNTQLLASKLNVLPFNVQLPRNIAKHWNPKWKKYRKEKVIKVDLSQFEKKSEDDEISKEEKRSKMKERGIFPQKPWQEKPMYISATGNVFEPYVPPEGDGKFSAISKAGAKQNVEVMAKKTKSWQAVKKIRKYEEEFDAREFPDQAMRIYIEAHTALVKKDEPELSNWVTEKLFPEMLMNMEYKTIVWKFIKSLEPARVVYARCQPLISETNMFAQVTVRFHTQQILAVYDRFGRLMSGSEILAKDVLEYLVLEKHLSNEYGRWRLHSKIIPPWMPLRSNMAKTFVK